MQFIGTGEIEDVFANASQIGGINRYALALNSPLNAAANFYNILTSAELYSDPTFDPNENKTWWDQHWFEFLQYALFGLTFLTSVVLMCIPGTQAFGMGMFAAGMKAAVSGFVIGGLIGGIVSAVQGNNFIEGAAKGAVQGAINGFTTGALLFCLTSAVSAIASKVKAANQVKQPNDGLGDLDWDSVVGKNGETRYEHVMKHATANPNKVTHTVFSGDPIATTNQAWAMRGGVSPILEGSSHVYNIPFANAGVGSLNGVRIVTIANTNKLISAYPILLF